MALAGFAASLVDGALGMGFGPTSSSILLNTGLSPAGVSATVNLAKVATGIAAAISHWRFRNIDHRLVLRLAIPGCVGAVVGVTVLSNVDGDDLKPALAVMLLLIGLRILWRFRHQPAGSPADGERPRARPRPHAGVRLTGRRGRRRHWRCDERSDRRLGPDRHSVPVAPWLTPRFAIGSVNTAEVAVAVVSASSIIASFGGDGFELSVVVAMLLGGVVAAPLAALVVRRMPARPIGLAVGASAPRHEHARPRRLRRSGHRALARVRRHRRRGRPGDTRTPPRGPSPGRASRPVPTTHAPVRTRS